jgi:BirA family transcriptional regulator, biotin operon repressor / biotin---[acetyl-CoA-carboxylase] ligase
MAVSIAGGIGLPAGQGGVGDVHPPLLSLLADGQLRSGEWLATALGVSRAAVWKGIGRLRQRGIEVESVRRRGYRLPAAVQLLDRTAILAAMTPSRAAQLVGFELSFEVDSTNTRLLAAAPPPYGSANVMMSELQHAGRGRRGRQWLAPFGGSLALSLGWEFAEAARVSPSLSLCVGVAVVRALERAGARGMALKWPNDIWFGDRKVGGVLLEMRAEASGPAYVVIGVGLNVSLSAAAREQVEATGVRVAAAADACKAMPERNFIAGAMIDELLSMLSTFEREGFAAFREAWESLDALRGRSAQVLMGHNMVTGTACGVDAHGALRLESAGRMQEFVSGEVSLRLGEDDI